MEEQNTIINKIRRSSSLIITTLFLFVFVAMFVVISDKQKTEKKLKAELAYYKENQNNLDTQYRNYISEIEKARLANKIQMQQSEKTYNDLLLKQPDLIKQHTTYGTPVASKPSTTSNTNPNTSSPSVKVVKPISKPKTRAS